MSDTDADNVVTAAEAAIIRECGQPHRTAAGRSVEARLPHAAEAAAVAVLRTLADTGDTWEPDILAALADDIATATEVDG